MNYTDHDLNQQRHAIRHTLPFPSLAIFFDKKTKDILMKDFYAILGLSSQPTPAEIKKAYRERAMKAHPDKGGSDAQMGVLAEAYETLIDPEKRQQFDEDWAMFQQLDEKASAAPVASLETDALSASYEYQALYAAFLQQYPQSPLQRCGVTAAYWRARLGLSMSYLSPFTAGIYLLKWGSQRNDAVLTAYGHDQRLSRLSMGFYAMSALFIGFALSGTVELLPLIHAGSVLLLSGLLEWYYRSEPQHIVYYHDLFEFIAAKSLHERTPTPLPMPTTALTPDLAVKLFTRFLKGRYSADDVLSLRNYFNAESARLRNEGNLTSDLLLYESITEIITTESITDQEQRLFFALAKLTAYAQQADSRQQPALQLLLSHGHFRHFSAYVIHRYWQAPIDQRADHLALFGRAQLTQAHEETLKQRLWLSRGDSHARHQLKNYLLAVRSLRRLEERLERKIHLRRAAPIYLSHAFYLIDFIPALRDTIDAQGIVNLYLQAGLCFQQAAWHETTIAKQWAAEKLAQEMYLQAYQVGRHTRIDVELYAGIHSIKYLAALSLPDPARAVMMESLQRRMAIIMDLFPFVEPIQPTLNIIQRPGALITATRPLLHELIRRIEATDVLSRSLATRHDEAMVRYHAYEALLKHWYQDVHDPRLEQQLRLALMESLLAERGWTFLDVDQNINPLWIAVNQDTEGWFQFDRLLPSTEFHPAIKAFHRVAGLEINTSTGAVNVRVKPLDSKEQVPLIEATDLQELLARNISHAIFSLDPIDSVMFYHPLNTLRFAPTKLYQTKLLTTLFLADYLLKFLTLNQEIRGRYPYDTRSFEPVIKQLPPVLRKILDDFHQTQSSSTMHRFWIEAEAIPVAIEEQATASTYQQSIALGEVTMMVNKHRMIRDLNGHWVDSQEDQDGWEFYLLAQAPHQLSHRFKSPAIIFITADEKVYFIHKNRTSATFTLSAPTVAACLQLRHEQCDQHQRVLKTPRNRRLLYQTILAVTQECKQPHYFSPEFVFAQEFTEHYDEFARYFPELARLKELSKLMIVVLLLNNIHKMNQQNITKLKQTLTDKTYWHERESPIRINQANYERQYQQEYKKIHQALKVDFGKFTKEIATDVFLQKHRASLNQLAQKIRDSYTGSTLPASLRRSYQQQLRELFAPHLASSMSTYEFNGLLEAFIDGRTEPMVMALTTYDRRQAKEQIQKLFPDCALADVNEALEGSQAALVRLSTRLTEQRLVHYKRDLDKMLAEQREHIANEKKQMTDQLAQLQAFAAKLEQLGVGQQTEEPVLAGQCLWVPANLRHEVGDLHSRLVYGGVRLTPAIHLLQPEDKQHRALFAAFSYYDRFNAHLLADTGRAAHAHISLDYKNFDAKATEITRDAKTEIAREDHGARAGGGSGGDGGGSRPPSPTLDEEGSSSDGEHRPQRTPLQAHSLWSSSARQAELKAPNDEATAPQKWTKRGRIKAAKLPSEGAIRYIPDERWHPSQRLKQGDRNGFVDKFGNEWIKGPSRTPGEPFEWDVQLSPLGQKQLGWASRDGQHINVSLKGRITHK